MSKHETLDEVTEWAVLYGDGEVEPFSSPFIASARIKELRRRFVDGLDPEGYEPMRVVRRTVATCATKWKPWEA